MCSSDLHAAASAAYKCFAEQNLETGRIHFYRFEKNPGSPWDGPWGAQVIGTKFVLYRETHAKPRDKRIKLVK